MKYIFYHWFPKPSRSKTEKSKWEKKICLVIEDLGSEASCDGTENSRNLDFQRCSRRNRRSRFSHTSSLSNTQSWRKKTEPPSTKMQETICQKEGWEEVAEKQEQRNLLRCCFPGILIEKWQTLPRRNSLMDAPDLKEHPLKWDPGSQEEKCQTRHLPPSWGRRRSRSQEDAKITSNSKMR